jgi:hypothetical protein
MEKRHQEGFKIPKILEPTAKIFVYQVMNNDPSSQKMTIEWYLSKIPILIRNPAPSLTLWRNHPGLEAHSQQPESTGRDFS